MAMNRIDHYMVATPISLRGSSSSSFLYHLPRQFSISFRKRYSETSRPQTFDFSKVNEQEGTQIQANAQTYQWLLQGYLQSGSLIEAKKLHATVLKSGFDADHSITSGLLRVYVCHGDFDDAEHLFDKMPDRSVSTWNLFMSGLLRKKMNDKLFWVFSRMLVEDVIPDETTFSHVLRSCIGDKVAFGYVKQIHAKVIRLGWDTSSLICNPLIDLYSKSGFVGSAKRVFQRLSTRDSVSWVAMISGLSQNGCEEEAVSLFNAMNELGIVPTPYIFSSVISACTKIRLFELGQQLHGLVFKWAFESETFVCNALVTLYTRSEKFLSAEQIFLKMKTKDEVSYNSLISGLSQSGYCERALQLFEKMQLDLLKPDSVTIASLLSACASEGALLKGSQLHCYAIKAGMFSDVIIEGSLLDLYVKCADIETAHEFFHSTNKENIVLWNVMLVAYGQIGDLKESFQIFSDLLIRGLRPNQFTYPSILRTCTSVGALDLGEQIHTQVIKTGFQPNAYVCSVLIDMYAKHGNLNTAHKILSQLKEKDVVSWTALIAGYAQHDRFVEALQLFGEMQDEGILADNIGFSSAISACAGIQAFNQGRQIHAQAIVCGYMQDVSIGNALVCLYARCGRIEDAYSAFDGMKNKDNISWNGLISGFAQSGHYEEALKVFSRMTRAGVELNMFTFGSAVSAAANTANIKEGKQIHARIIQMGYEAETETSNALVTLYAKCGSLGDAKREFSQMPDKNEISWNAMITCYSQHGCGREAIELFEEMKMQAVMADHVTFVGVLSACSHAGLVDKGLSYFKSMSEEHGLVPKPEHYVCVVDMLGRAGLLSRAREFIEAMPIEPEGMIWRTLLSACTVHKNIEIGEVAASRLLELEPEDSATYVLLSNMYAVAGKWGLRDLTRQMMKERGVKKEPGRSWIEVKNSIHAFFVGDRLHPLADGIYEFLEDLNKRAGAIGYLQDHSSLLSDVEKERKDPSVYIHSEKLAIAFGLLTLSSALPVRVMKNLRVCSDCHNWIKFVSKVSDRAIVVRDAYRFHHFEGGVCSCNDYW